MTKWGFCQQPKIWTNNYTHPVGSRERYDTIRGGGEEASYTGVSNIIWFRFFPSKLLFFILISELDDETLIPEMSYDSLCLLYVSTSHVTYLGWTIY